MKKITALLSLLLCFSVGKGFADGITVNDITFTPDGQGELILNCTFTQKSITLYQFDLYLPAGIAPAYDEAKQDYDYELSSNHTSEHALQLKDNGAYYRIVVASTSNQIMAPNKGMLLKLRLMATKEAEGEAQGSIKGFSLFATDETEVAMTDATFKTNVHLRAAEDLNGDGSVNVGDVTTLVNMILGKAPKDDNADLNADGSINVGDVTTLVNKILGKV